ncbi:MAG: hypothetical protein D6B28_05510 [Gammaproteobacteria bacterium]|nr:MAG: hypothetical protein D6B28_05510 [Gammaproteobacteria bacterium]
MIEDVATVVAEKGEDVVIESIRKSSCSSCGAGSACGTNVLATLFDQNSRNPRLTLKNTVGAKVGDKVIVGIDEKIVIKSSFFVYIVPVLSMILFAAIGLVAGDYIGMESDAASSILGLVGLLLGFGWLYYYSKKLATEKQYKPVILRVDNTHPDCESKD